jgi:hypothetical protein
LAKEKGVQIHILLDVVAANAFSNANDAETQIVDVKEIPEWLARFGRRSVNHWKNFKSNHGI